MNRSQIIYRLWKTVLLLVSGAVLSSGVAWAQSADDVKITATATEAKCIQDGTVTISVTSVPGSVYQIESITYDLRDEEGNSLAGASGQFVTNNLFNGLKKGTYKAYAKVLFNNNVTVIVGPVSATVVSDYKVPAVAIKLERKPLKSFKPNGASAPLPTGIISVKITGGNRPDYKVKMTQKPATYNGVTELDLVPDTKIYFYELPKGNYSFQVFDKCGGQEVQTIDLKAVDFDAPQGGVVPFGTHPRASDETRAQCGWFFFPYQTRGVAQYEGNDQDLHPYLSPTESFAPDGRISARDTLAKYYDYGFAYGNNKPSTYYATGARPFVDNMDNTGAIAAEKGRYEFVFGRILKGKKWSDAGFVDRIPKPNVNTMNNDVFPGLFLRVKGSSDQMVKGYRSQIIKNLPEEFTIRWYTIVDSCAITYKVNIKPSDSGTELYCFPISVGLFAENKTTRLGTSEDVILTRLGQATNFNDYVLRGGETYWIRTTDGTGSVVEYPVRMVNDFKYTGIAIPSKEDNMFDICNRKRGTSIELNRYTPTTIPFLMHDVTLVSAPGGYQPGEDGLAVGETFRFPPSFPSNIKPVSRFYAFGKKSELFTIKREIFAPNGNYVFRIYDRICKKTYNVTVEITTAQTPLWTVNEDSFQPRVVNASCGRVRIYPFRKENATNLLFKSEFWEVKPGGVKEFVMGPVPYPQDLMVYVDKFPDGLDQKDITHNFSSGSTWVWQYYRAAWWVSGDPNDHENLYIELPKINGEIVLKIAPFSRSIEYDKVFRRLPCMPEYSINLSNIPLSYERETYIGYACEGSLSGRLHIVPTNNVGGVKIDLYREGEPNPFATKTLTKEQVKDGASFDLTGTADKPIPGKLRAVLTDTQCSNYNDESIIIYSLDSPDIIKTPNQQRKYCEGETIKLSVMNLGEGVNYTWRLPNGETKTGQKIEISNATSAHSGEYEVFIENILCEGLGTTATLKFVISVAPRELWWRKDAQDADWHNLNNWARRDGTPVQAVPAPCTVVHIPASVDKAFPDLAGEVTKRDIYGAPECDDIYFHYGSQLGTPQLLSYSKAFVDYNFGMNQPQGSNIYTPYVQQGHPQANEKLLDRNRWYMIAIPLKEVPAGDFGLGGHPRSYQRYLKVSAQDPLTDASFVKPFNSYSESLNNHNNAMALKVAGSTPSVPLDADKEKYLNATRGIIRLPLLYKQDRFEGDSRLSAYRDFALQQTNSQILFTYYNERTLELTNRQELHNRVLPDAFRFVFENKRPGKIGKIGSILINGAATEGYALAPKPAGGVNDWIMLGNPFMTPMDFDKFYEVNQDKIQPYYYLFTENTWRIYTKGTSGASGVAKQIAPLQSIVVKRKAVGDFLFPTSGAKSVLLPSWRTDQPGRYSVKSSEEVTVAEIPLTINVANREGDYSQAFLGWSDEVSAPVFVNSEYASMPTVFLVEPDAGDYNAITYPKRAHGTINLGVASSLSSPLTLSFDHIDRSVYEELTLVDKHEGVEQDLLSNPQYDFIHKPDTTPATRFALRIKRFGITNITSSDEMPIAEFKMFYRAGSLRIESPDALHRVVVYDMQGKTLADEVLTDNATRTVEVDTNNAHGVVVVEVFFKNGMRTVRKYDLR